jgi:CubicO group peptidase (beta-lactamase class C family)
VSRAAAASRGRRRIALPSRRRRTALLLASALLAAGAAGLWLARRPPAFHEPADVGSLARELDKVVPAALREHGVPGASVAIVHRGQVRWSAAYGLADAGRREPMRPDSVLQVASISKPLAALTVLRLARAGRLDLDRPVEDFTGGWRLPASPFDAREVTLRRILSHTAGLGVPGYPGMPDGPPLPSTRAALAGASGGGAVVLVDEPGTGWRYSGGGYTVAQLAAEEATGRSFGVVAREEVLGPLGMDSSGFSCTVEPRDPPGTAAGHDERGRPIPRRRFADLAAAGLCSTAGDLGRLAAALMDEPEGAAMAEAAPATGGAYGLGLFRQDLRDGAVRLWHDGSNPGFHARMELHPGRDWAVVVLTNGDGGMPVLEDVTRLLVR